MPEESGWDRVQRLLDGIKESAEANGAIVFYKLPGSRSNKSCYLKEAPLQQVAEFHIDQLKQLIDLEKQESKASEDASAS